MQLVACSAACCDWASKRERAHGAGKRGVIKASSLSRPPHHMCTSCQHPVVHLLLPCFCVPQIQTGDKVLYFKYAGDNMETPRGEKFVVLREDDILCKA